MVNEVHSWTAQGLLRWARPYACVARVKGPSRSQKGTFVVGTVEGTGIGSSDLGRELGLVDCHRRGRSVEGICRRNKARWRRNAVMLLSMWSWSEGERVVHKSRRRERAKRDAHTAVVRSVMGAQ